MECSRCKEDTGALALKDYVYLCHKCLADDVKLEISTQVKGAKNNNE